MRELYEEKVSACGKTVFFPIFMTNEDETP